LSAAISASDVASQHDHEQSIPCPMA